MKTKIIIISIFFLSFSFLSFSQIRDTIVMVNGKNYKIHYDISWGYKNIQKFIFENNEILKKSLQKTSTDIVNILNSIPLTNEPCLNGDFENGYNGWTGLSLQHTNTSPNPPVIPIENGLNLNPGISTLPLTNNSFGGNFTIIESIALDPNLLTSIPSVSLQKVKSGNHSIRLGNFSAGYGAEGIAKRFKVTTQNAVLYFQYAIVMDKSHSNSDGSINGSEVFFVAEAVDMQGNPIDKVIDVGNPSNPFINQATYTINNNQYYRYYRNWRCAKLDLSSKIGEEVVIMFVNSDCSYSAHMGYTYLDAVCDSCKNTNEGDISINLGADSCMTFPQTINGTFTLPASNLAQNMSISLLIYQNNILVNTISNPVVTGTSYSFTLSSSDFPNTTNGQCYDLVSKLSFDYPNMNGTLVQVNQLSSPVNGSSGIQDGVRPGVNNDVCFCSTDLCCQIPNFSATLSGNNLNNLTLSLNSGTNQIQEVEVSMVDYHATYSEPGCQPVNMDASGGHIGYMTTTTNNLATLNLVTAQNNSHVLDWLPGSPALLSHIVNLSVNPPSVINVSCCSVYFSFCIKVRVKDVNCNVCEQILCYPSSTACHCGSWGNTPIQVIGIINSDSLVVQPLDPPIGTKKRPSIGTPVNCGDSITLTKGEYVFSVPDYNCIPNTNAATYQWMVQGPVTGSGTGKPFNFNFSQPGTYSVTITPFCCNQQCDPCEFKVIVPEPSCRCGKWYNGTMYLGINPQTPLSSRPYPLACGGTANYDGPRSLHIGVSGFSCIPASCQATYKWDVSGPVSGNNIGVPFDFNFSQAGTYTVTVTPICGNQRCEPCKITVIIRPVTKCDCNGPGWIKDKPTLILNESGQVAGNALNGGSITLLNPGLYQFMVPPYICNPAPPECVAGYKWEVQGPVSGIGSGSTFIFNFTQTGSYAVIITAICGIRDCLPFVFKVTIGQSCDCGKWTDNKITINWKDRRGNQTASIDCDNSVPFSLSDVCSNVPFTGNFSDFICIPTPPVCNAKYFWVVLDQNNNAVASGNDTPSTSFSFNITSGGNYQFVVTPKCGDKRCEPCRIRFYVKNVINCN